MVISKTSVLVKLFMRTRSGYEAGWIRSACCIANITNYDMNDTFFQLGQQSKIRGWGQDTQVLVSWGLRQLSWYKQHMIYQSKFRGIQNKCFHARSESNWEDNSRNCRCCWRPKWFKRIHWLHALNTPAFWAGGKQVFAKGIIRDSSSVNHSAPKMTSLKKKKSIFKLWILSGFSKMMGDTLHATCWKRLQTAVSQWRMRNFLFFPTIKIPRI